MQYTKEENPRPPSVEEVVAWVSTSWESAHNDVICKYVVASKFDIDYHDWHIAKHDVYGGIFQSRWVRDDEESSNDADGAGIAEDFDDLVVE